MLRQLLDSLGKMTVPADTSVTILIVENDDSDQSSAIVEAANPAENQVEICYVHEPELGIPFGRNRAAREAIELGADLLFFVDDDEVVPEDWLDLFIAGYRASNARLMGAPLRTLETSHDLGWYRTILSRGVEARYQKKEKRAARLASIAETPGVTVVTNNWLGETSLFSHDGIWFDETMRFTGGTDSKFYADAKELGIATGWVENAPVYEEIPPQRLSLRYQFSRGRDQSATNFHRKLKKSRWAAASVVASVPFKILGICALLVSVPFSKGQTLIDAARQLGWIAGRFSAIAGRQSKLYRNVTGD